MHTNTYSFKPELIHRYGPVRLIGSIRSTMRHPLLFCSLSIAMLSSCTTDKDKDGIPDNKDKCPTEYAKTANGCPAEQQISSVRFFMDRSGSMSGYYKGETEFVNVTDDLLAKMESIRPVKEIWMVSDSAVKFEGNAEAFRQQVLRTQPQGTKSSMLDEIFANIAAKTDTNDISVFVSDGILSYSDLEIKRNPDINKEKASALGTDIYSIFNKLRKSKGFGVSVYAFKSAFNGTYYNYQNGKIKLSGEKRPYYIWVIGRNNLLNKFNTELADFSTFKPLEQMHFGLDEQPVAKAAFMPAIERAGAWSINSEGTGIDEVGKTSKFSLALNLSALPPYTQQTAYLKEHLQLDAKGCIARLQVKNKQEIDVTKLKSDRQKEALEASTHVLIIEVTQMNTRKASINITLPIIPDPWYQTWSCEDDLNLKKNCAGQTFAFRYLIDGMAQAYQNNRKNYIELSIPLQQ